MNIVEIMDTDNDGILAVQLVTVLERLATSNSNVTTLEWCLLELEATGDLGPQWDWVSLNTAIDSSRQGLVLKWGDLYALAGKIIQTINALIIGKKKDVTLQKSNWSQACEIAVEFIDSSVCRVSTGNPNVVAALQDSYRKVTVRSER